MASRDALRIHHMLDPENPELAAARATVWSAIVAHPASFLLHFKFARRWITVSARPGGDLYFRFRNGKNVTDSWVPRILRHLTETEWEDKN